MMRPRLAARATVVVTLVLTLGLTTPALAQPATPVASPTGPGLQAAVDWLLTQQADDGGFVGFTGESDPGVTADAVVTLAAAEAAGVETGDAIETALAYLEGEALVYAQTGGGQAAKLALGVIAAGADPRDINGVDPLSLAEASLKQDTGLYGTGVFDHALVMLALAGAGEPVPDAAVDALAETSTTEGSWAFDASTEAGAGDSNTTALVVQALVAAGHEDNPLVADALAYLKTTQAEAGGFTFQPADPIVADANSTALAIQAIIAAGEDPAAAEWRDAAGALAAFQNPSGAFGYNADQPDDNLLATLQAIPALAGVPLPVVDTDRAEAETPIDVVAA